MRTLWHMAAATILAVGLMSVPAGAQQAQPGRQGQHDMTTQPNQTTQPSEQAQRNQPEQPGEAPSQAQDMGQEYAPALVEAHDLLGHQVDDPQMRSVGSVQDVVLGPRFQEVDYVVVGTGGFLGIGRKYHAVPWSAFEVMAPEKSAGSGKFSLVMETGADRLDKMPGFSRRNWPAEANPAFTGGDSGQETPGGMPGGAPADQDIQQRRVSHLIDTAISDTQDQQIGRTRDFVIDTNGGQVAYALVAVDPKVVKIKDPDIALPWSSVRRQGSTWLVRATPEQLDQLAFDPSQGLSRLENPTFASRLHDAVDARPYWQTHGEQVGQPGRPVALTGTIQSISQEGPTGDQEVVLRLLTPQGEEVAVRLGPAWYAEQQDVTFQPGEQVSVTGFRTGEGGMMAGRPGRPQGQIMASVVRTPRRTLELRDTHGQPMWQQPAEARRQRQR